MIRQRRGTHRNSGDLDLVADRTSRVNRSAVAGTMQEVPRRVSVSGVVGDLITRTVRTGLI